MSISFENIPSSSVLLSAAASLTATAILLKSISNDLIPVSLQDYLSSRLQLISNRMSFYLTVVVEEFDGLCPNHMFEAANTYLGEKISPSTQRIKVNKPEKDHELTITVDKNQEILDVFDKNVKLKWVLQSSPVKMSAQISKNGPSRTEVRYFELSFLKKHKATVLKSYLPHVIRKAKEMKEEIKVVRLNTVDYQGGDYWSSVALKHPATFDTIAMDPELKKVLMEDLDRFLSRKDYYKRVGKAWKRGYLFYGPPGTGKSSLVAAMANYLKFDVYDLDLKEVQCNSDLRRLLIGSANRSILVIEDIDCNFGLQNRELDTGVGVVAEDDKITLSGLLNFIDGLWSSCGDERIIIFTTNHKDRLDPALLRPGRMDVQIEMSYCTFVGFKILAYKFLMIKEHDLFRRIEELLSKVDATPAEVAGELMKSDNADVALLTLESFLQDKEKKA